jgi:hypothetical protein
LPFIVHLATLNEIGGKNMKKILRIVIVTLFILVAVVIALAWRNMRDRHPGYALDLYKSAKGTTPVTLKVGLAKTRITPDVQDTWVDADSNGRYEPKKGDSYIDKNGNKKFDAFWLAGFHDNRPAMSVHDDLWARAILFEDGSTRVAMVVIDAIGFFHDNVIEVRNMVAAKPWAIDHVIISSTHCHEVPDLMGLWGPGPPHSGVNPEYLQMVKERIVEAIGAAYEQRQEAYLQIGRIDSTARDLVRDSRPPRVMDDAIHLMQIRSTANDSLLGLLMNWGDHPETLASDNLQVTADFCHYWISGVENGIVYDQTVKRPGVGGLAVFANGCVGGLMTSLGCKVQDPWLKRTFEKASFEKARSQGYRLADLVLQKMQSGPWQKVDNPAIGLWAHTFTFTVDNDLFRLGGALRVLDRGFVGFNAMRTEVNLMTLGSVVSILTLPGEVYPEIVNGGVEAPEGHDIATAKADQPSLRSLMPGSYKFVVGLANDEIGYIIPESQWDSKAPYTYGHRKPLYGEVNSCGPDAAVSVYREARALISLAQK